MASLKATPVKIAFGKDIKPAVIATGGIEYNPLDDVRGPKLVEEIIRNIDTLDKCYHEQIYTVLRRFKPKKFFAPNNVNTTFNINGLNAQELQELNRTVQLCITDMQRRKVLEEATGEHRDEISKLEEKIRAKVHSDPPLDDTYVIGPSETERVKEMLQMIGS